MNLPLACEDPVQPSLRTQDRAHPRFAEYLRYRDAFARQLVAAPPFESWLRQREEFEPEGALPSMARNLERLPQ